MDIVDQIKDAAEGHGEEIDSVIEQVGDFIDQKTGGQFAAQVDQAQGFLEGQLGGEAK